MSADGEVRCQDLTEETTSTLSGNEKFVMFDSTEGKQADIDDVNIYMTGNKANLQTTEKGSIVGAINELKTGEDNLKEDFDALGLSVVNGAINVTYTV